MKMRPKDLWKRLMVKFRGEEGLDYGGVARYEQKHSSLKIHKVTFETEINKTAWILWNIVLVVRDCAD